MCSFKKVKQIKPDWIYPNVHNGKMSLTEILCWIMIIKRCWPSFHIAFIFSFYIWIAWVTTDTKKQRSHWVKDSLWIAQWLHEEPVKWNLSLSLGYTWIVSDVDWIFSPLFWGNLAKTNVIVPRASSEHLKPLWCWGRNWKLRWVRRNGLTVSYSMGVGRVDRGTRHPGRITVYALSKSRWIFI